MSQQDDLDQEEAQQRAEFTELMGFDPSDPEARRRVLLNMGKQMHARLYAEREKDPAAYQRRQEALLQGLREHVHRALEEGGTYSDEEVARALSEDDKQRSQPPYSMHIDWDEQDQRYSVTLPEWENRNGVHVWMPCTYGETYEEAIKNGREALAALMEEDEDEREWDRIVSQQSVQQALERRAEEAVRHYEAGETEDGGFGVEDDEEAGKLHLVLTLDDDWVSDEEQLAYALSHLSLLPPPDKRFHEWWIELSAPLTREQVRALKQLQDESGLFNGFHEEEK
jgi:predicted RNase H-like HicB family nuclease